LEKFALWWSHSWVLIVVCAAISLTAAPIKTFEVVFETVNGDALVEALAKDMDILETVEEQTQQIGQLIPVEKLTALEDILGKERTDEIVTEAVEIRDGVGKEVATATGRTVDDIVRGVPRFIKGQDLKGSELRDKLQIDLRPFKSSIEAWLTKAGRLLVGAISEAVQAQINKFMKPAISELVEGQEYDGLMDRLDTIDASFETIQKVTKIVEDTLSASSGSSSDAEPEIMEAVQKFKEATAQLSTLGMQATRQGRAVLEQASTEEGVTDWGLVVETVTKEMLSDSESRAKELTEGFAQDFTTAIFGSGLYAMPQPARILFVEQLRPVQVIVAPVISAGNSLIVMLNAMLCSIGILLVLTAGRIRRLAFWVAGGTMAVGLSGIAFVGALTAVAVAAAKAIGGIGEGAKEIGTFIGWMLGQVRKALDYLLDIKFTEFNTIDGWNPQDVLDSHTYGVIQADIFDALSGWSDNLITLAMCSAAIWIGLLVVERIARKRPAAEAGTWVAAFQQPGGIRIEDPLLLLLPSKGENFGPTAVHSAASAALLRGIFVDLSWLFLIAVGSFTLVGLVLFPVLQGATVAVAAMTSAAVTTTALLVPRITFAGISTISGWLADDTIHAAPSDAQTTIKTTLMSTVPWLAAIALGMVLTISLDSPGWGFGVALALLLAVEATLITLGDGQVTAGSKMVGAGIRTHGHGISKERRVQIIELLYLTGTVWSLVWGALTTVLMCGLGLYALISGGITASIWCMNRSGPPGLGPVRNTSLLRLGNFLSLDWIGVAIGMVTLRLLQDEGARDHFSGKHREG
jgi:hypothetical protein